MNTRYDQYSLFPSRVKLQRATVSISNTLLAYLTSQHGNKVLILLKRKREGTYRPEHIIQGVSRLVDITSGGDFLGLCNQKSSYKYMSDFGRLRSYEHFLIPVQALVWTALRNQLAGDVLNLLDYRLRCKHYFCHLIAALSIVISWLELSSTSQSTDDSNVYGQKT